MRCQILTVMLPTVQVSWDVIYHYIPGELKPHSHSCKNLQTCIYRFNYQDLIICIFNCQYLTSFDSTKILTLIQSMCTVKYTKYNILTLNTKAWITINRNRCKTEGMDVSGIRSNGGKQESGTKSFKGEADIQDFWQSYNQHHREQHQN